MKKQCGSRIIAAGAALLMLAGAAMADGLLKPYKDDLFSYRTPLKSADSGAYLVIDYDEMRDINGRDAIVEKRVQDQYVSLRPRAHQKDVVLPVATGNIHSYMVGTPKPATSLIVMYLHGKGGSRHQGINDYTFGGNFNRLKNLVHQASGVYLSPDFADFGKKGTAQLAGLIAYLRQQSPRAKLVVACGSAGGVLCWQLAADEGAGPQLDGLVLLGSLWDDGFRKTPAYKRKLPVFLGHGSRDPVFAIDSQEAFYRSLRKTAGGYPVTLHRFESGNHGTPIRMTDWRLVLNRLLHPQVR